MRNFVFIYLFNAEGQVPTGKLLWILLAFGTYKTSKYTDGTDLVDKFDPNNHTIKFMDRSKSFASQCDLNHTLLILFEISNPFFAALRPDIFRDYLISNGFNCTKDEAKDFISKHATKSDACVECGQVGAGNDAVEFEKQVNTRFEPFSSYFKDWLKIKDGPSVIDTTEYWNYKGIHFTAGAGLMNVVLGAFLAANCHPDKRMRLVVESTRFRRLLFVCEGGDENAVIENPWMIICPFIHPNFHQTFLGKLGVKEVRLLDLSYSTALAGLDGVQIVVQGKSQEFTAALSNSSEQRRAINKKLQEESKANATITQEEIEALKEVKMYEKRLAKHQKIEAKKKERGG